MRILHQSDQHGTFPKLKGNFDAIISSGDLLPNDWARLDGTRHGLPKGEPKFQREFILRKAHRYQRWIGDKPFIHSSGNHDFINPVPVLKEIGINAVDATEQMITFDGLTIYGFPYIPHMGGKWNYELFPSQMADKIEQLGYILEANKVDILIAHCLPYGILDFTDPIHGSEHIGNTHLMNAINYRWEYLPKILCCGHIHEAAGISIYKNMLISNAATTSHIIEI